MEYMITDSIAYLAEGLLLGLAAGIAPGPLLTLVISESLAHGRAEGIKVALSPLFTDAPVILLCVLILNQLGRLDFILGILALAGAGYLVFLGIENIRFRKTAPASGPAPAHSLRKGIITNLLNPHPYLFWITVGTPLLAAAAGAHWLGVVFFLAGFYIAIVGVKMAVALLAAGTRVFLSGNIYVWIVRIMGLVLLAFAILLLREGLEKLGII
jgi:threonine/homoserine/homoserine lactone efflux protein